MKRKWTTILICGLLATTAPVIAEIVAGTVSESKNIAPPKASEVESEEESDRPRKIFNPYAEAAMKPEETTFSRKDQVKIVSPPPLSLLPPPGMDKKTFEQKSPYASGVSSGESDSSRYRRRGNYMGEREFNSYRDRRRGNRDRNRSGSESTD